MLRLLGGVDLVLRRLVLFKRKSWIFDLSRCVPIDTKSPSKRDGSNTSNTFQQSVVEWQLNVGPQRADPFPAGDLSASLSLQARRKDKERLLEEKRLSDDKLARDKKEADALQRTKKQLKAQEAKQLKAAAVASQPAVKPPRSASKLTNEHGGAAARSSYYSSPQFSADDYTYDNYSESTWDRHIASSAVQPLPRAPRSAAASIPTNGGDGGDWQGNMYRQAEEAKTTAHSRDMEMLLLKGRLASEQCE